MLSYTFIPFLLALNVPVPEGTTHFNAEYWFDYNRTTVLFRGFPQITRLTAQLICQPYLERTLHCFLQNLTSMTTLRYENLDAPKNIMRELKSEQWFEFNFNMRGVQNVLTHTMPNDMIIRLIRDVADQFNMGGDMMTELSILHLLSSSVAYEKTSIGTCTTKYTMNMVYEDIERDKIRYSKFQIVPLAMAEHSAKQRGAHIHIEKDRKACRYLPNFIFSLDGMEVSKYIYTMKIVNDKLKTSTVMEVQPRSHLWNNVIYSKPPLLRETTLLNLINIRSPQTMVPDKLHNWVSITI